MVGGAAQIVKIENDDLSVNGVSHIAVGLESADRVLGGGCGGGVVRVHELVRGKIRIERDPEQPTLSGRIHSQSRERRREKRAVLDHSQRPALLSDKEAPIRSEFHRRRIRQTAGDERVLELRAYALRSATLNIWK